MGDKGLDQFPAGAAKGLRPTEVCRVGLYEIHIKVVLANQKAELIAEFGLTGRRPMTITEDEIPRSVAIRLVGPKGIPAR